jgi:hypothetical protein
MMDDAQNTLTPAPVTEEPTNKVLPHRGLWWGNKMFIDAHIDNLIATFGEDSVKDVVRRRFNLIDQTETTTKYNDLIRIIG